MMKHHRFFDDLSDSDEERFPIPAADARQQNLPRVVIRYVTSNAIYSFRNLPYLVVVENIVRVGASVCLSGAYALKRTRARCGD